MARLFLAVWPDEEATAELRTLPRKDQAGVRFVPPERWHVTMRFLGEAHPYEVAGAVDAALARAPLPATEVRYGPAVDVLGERQLVVPAQGLDQLAAVLTAATAHLGEPPPRRRFVGHVAIARLKPRARGFRMPAALGVPVAAEQEVDEITLVESRLHPEGPDYTTLHTWPLGAGASPAT